MFLLAFDATGPPTSDQHQQEKRCSNAAFCTRRVETLESYETARSGAEGGGELFWGRWVGWFGKRGCFAWRFVFFFVFVEGFSRVFVV